MSDLPSPPFVNVPGIANFRDAGGQTTNNGKKVRNGLLFRSADPSKATVEGLNKMGKELGKVCFYQPQPTLSMLAYGLAGLKTIFDLRSAPEIRRDGPEWANVEIAKDDVFEPYGIHRDWVPVFAEQDYGPEQVAVRYKEYKRGGVGFVNAYRDILLAGSGPDGAYTKILKQLAKPDAKACLIHCTAGKDRTGVLVALLLMLVDVSKDAIAEEYSLTDLGLADLKPLFIERLLKHPELEGNRDGVKNMVSSLKGNMEASIDMIEGEFGGSHTYMRSKCGLTDAEIEQLKENLLES